MASVNKSYAPFLPSPGTTFADAVRYIAEVCGYRVGSLPPSLNAMTEHYGWCSFGLSLIDLGGIAEQFPGLEWDIRGDALLMDYEGAPLKVTAQKRLDPFYEIAGKLMAEAKRKGRRLEKGEYERIARELDKADIRLLGNLERGVNDGLGKWNQTHSWNRSTIRTWANAIVSREFRRGVQKTLLRAEEVYRKTRQRP